MPVPIEVVSAPVPAPEPRPPAPERRSREEPVPRRAARPKETAPAEPRRPQLLGDRSHGDGGRECVALAPRVRGRPGGRAATDRVSLPEPTFGASAAPLLSGPVGRSAGPSLLSDRGDVAVGAGRAIGRGAAELDRGAPGAVDSAIGRVTGREVAGMVAPGAVATLAVPGGPGGGDGPITALVRPLGGYQLTPPYPESARRQGVRARRGSASRSWPRVTSARSSWTSRRATPIWTGLQWTPCASGASSRPGEARPPWPCG